MIRFRMEWEDAPGVTDAVLARTWCWLAIEAGGRLVTEAVHHPTGNLRRGTYGSVFPLCEWIVENWWFLLNEPYRLSAPHASDDLAENPRHREWVQRHSLLAAREGFCLPDLTLHRDGGQIVARWHADPVPPALSGLRFTGRGETHIEVADAERGLADAIQTILDRLDGVAAPVVEDCRREWAAVLGVTKEERGICEAAAMLGIDAFDPDDLTPDLEDALRRGSRSLTFPTLAPPTHQSR